MHYRYCGCEDYPCCGHGEGGDRGPEDAQAFLDELTPDEREFADRYMRPCQACGEMRPKDDPEMRRSGGICHMCQQDGERQNSPTAARNLTFHRRKDMTRIRRLERLLREHGIDVPPVDEG